MTTIFETECSNFYIKESMKLAKHSIIMFLDSNQKARDIEEINDKISKENVMKFNEIYNKFFKDIIVDRVLFSIDSVMNDLKLEKDIGITCRMPNVKRLTVRFLNNNIEIVKHTKKVIQNDIDSKLYVGNDLSTFILEYYDMLIEHLEGCIESIKTQYPKENL